MELNWRETGRGKNAKGATPSSHVEETWVGGKSYKMVFPTPTRTLCMIGSIKAFHNSVNQTRVGGRRDYSY